MVIENSVSVKSRLNEQVKGYLMSLHDNKDEIKQYYASCFGSFVLFLEKKGIKHFEDASKTDIGQFQSTKKTQKTASSS